MALLRNLTGTNPSGDAANVEDVFSTYLYDGTGSSRTITNGIDLDGEGGMVWIKRRSYSGNHQVWDTHRGVNFRLFTENNGAQNDVTGNGLLTSFNTNGFSLGSDTNVNESVSPYNKFTSWTFRKAPRFFDVVTYTGNGTAGREIAHDLGCDVGMIVVKRTSLSQDWAVWQRTLTAGHAIYLNYTTSSGLNADVFTTTQPTSSVFSIGNDATTNTSGETYVAYLFAHDPDGANDDGMIACGSYTKTSGSGTFHSMDVGWEPQYVLMKRSDSTGIWNIADSMRGAVTGGDDGRLQAQASDGEYTEEFVELYSTGFRSNDVAGTYIYMAIRAPMMKEPEAGTEVFDVAAGRSGSSSTQLTNSDILTDFSLIKNVTSSGEYWATVSRLTGHYHLQTNSSTAHGSGALANPAWDTMTGVKCAGSNGATNSPSGTMSDYSFKRAKGFFDVVAYTGTGSAHTENHSLGVAPEMMIVKERGGASSWFVYNAPSGNSKTMQLNYAGGEWSSSDWNSTTPTDAVFTINTASLNNSTDTYIAYLFATLAGVSKVGNYTGNGSSQNIACGFSAGARFVLIKRTDSTGDWYIWDTTRGIVTGNDPHLSLNTTSAEVTTDDSIDPQSAGFTVNQVAATNINVTSATYIFLAIA